ncbi:MAG: hypothetical protein K5780_01295 [Alphaproteobacteria bacterium]|nr:hypothetical protein [Alphaproteobacteria bacterium]
MKLFYLVCEVLLILGCSTQVDAMNIPSEINGNFPNRRGDIDQRKNVFLWDIRNTEKQINDQMISIHRELQIIRSEMFSQITGIRQHFWQLEYELTHRANESKWIPVKIEKEQDEPFFYLIRKVNQSGKGFHGCAVNIFSKIRDLNQRVCDVFRKNYCLRKETRQLSSLIEKHRIGLLQDINGMEKGLDEMISEVFQDIHLVKMKVKAPWISISSYVTDLEMLVYKNIFDLRRNIVSLGSIVFDDMMILFQNARVLQIEMKDEVSYRY